MRHQCIFDSLLEFGAPRRLVHAVLQELTGSQFQVSFQGLRWDWSDFRFEKGGRQGGTETPFLWTLLLDVAMIRAREAWRAQGHGFKLVDPPSDVDGFLDCLIFADDVVLCAESLESSLRMLEIVSEELTKLSLTLKPGSMELLPVSVALQDRSFRVAGWEVRVVDRINLLGVLVDAVGSDETAVIAQGWAHFFDRQGAFTCSKVPLRLRWKRFSPTVLRTVLHGGGAWLPGPSLSGRLQVFEAKCLKIMLGYSDPDPANLEAVRDFHIRLNSKLKYLKELFSWTSLADMQVNLHIGWLGHVARLPCSSTLHMVYGWRNALWADVMRDGIRYARPGRPRKPVDSDVAQFLGLFWSELAQDRREWAAAKLIYLMSKGIKHDRETGLSRYPFHYSNKTLDLLGPRGMPTPLRVIFETPSLQVANVALGVWRVRPDSALSAYAKDAHWSLHVLQHKWRCCASGTASLVRFAPESDSVRGTMVLAKKVLAWEVSAVRALLSKRLRSLGSWPSAIVVSCVSKSVDDACAWAVRVEAVSDGVRQEVSYASFMCKVGNSSVGNFLALSMAVRHFVAWCIAEDLVI